jgi:AAA+ superfamily predicted ATPase
VAQEELIAGSAVRSPSAGHAWVALVLEREVVLAGLRDGVLRNGALGDGAAEGATTSDDVRGAFAPAVARERARLSTELEDPDVALTQVVTSCELDPVEAEVLAVCVAIELDEGLQAQVARATGNAAARRPTLGLLARMLGSEALVALAVDGRLRRAALLDVSDAGTFADAVVAVPRTVIWSALGDLSFDPDLPLGAEVATVPPELVGGHDLVLAVGEDPVRRVQAAVRGTWGMAFLVVDQPTDARGWAAVVRQAGVTGLGVVVQVGQDLSALGRWWIERSDHVAWALCSPERLALGSLPEREWHEVAVEQARVSDDEWTAVLGGTPREGRRLTAHQLQLVAVAAPSLGEPAGALHRLADGPMASSVRRVTPGVTWDDLVVGPTHLTRLKELTARYRYRSTVFGQWGLAEMPSPGLVALFGGPSGTGKTMTAEVIAADLGVDLLRVDLQAVVSKYIGETEKNLELIFAAASAGDCVLLFDEADALFGTRGKVSDARDRYANMEVSFLLQRLETYDGFVVLTTNFQGNIDPAFLRRVHASVHFTMPNPAERLAIWRRALANAPLDDVDLGFVAERFDLSGGAVRNAALTAAFLAASDRGSVRMEHLVRALASELTKMGRRPTPELFGEWHHLVPDAG